MLEYDREMDSNQRCFTVGVYPIEVHPLSETRADTQRADSEHRGHGLVVNGRRSKGHFLIRGSKEHNASAFLEIAISSLATAKF
jgi:hypothetical protein